MPDVIFSAGIRLTSPALYRRRRASTQPVVSLMGPVLQFDPDKTGFSSQNCGTRGRDTVYVNVIRDRLESPYSVRFISNSRPEDGQNGAKAQPGSQAQPATASVNHSSIERCILCDVTGLADVDGYVKPARVDKQAVPVVRGNRRDAPVAVWTGHDSCAHHGQDSIAGIDVGSLRAVYRHEAAQNVKGQLVHPDSCAKSSA